MQAGVRPDVSPKERSRQPSGLDSGAQLRAWLAVLDAVLIAVEQTAWQAREVGERTRRAWLEASDGFARVVAGSRALRQQVTGWPARMSRLAATGLTLTTIAATYRLHQTKAAFLGRERAARALERLHADNARRFYELSIRQGGAFLKVGQMLSSRPDLLPEAWIRELARLQDAAPEVPWSEIERMLVRELGGPIATTFAALDERPLASASIGQVHRATLVDGQAVAVKVQRPGIDELVALDLEVLELFVRGLAESLPPLDLDTIVSEVKQMVLSELDYELEAEATERVAIFFGNDPAIRAPRVVRSLSTKRVLITELMPGAKITLVLEELRKAREVGDPKAAARTTTILARVLEAFARQVLDLGLFQADPHPGNLLVSADERLTLLDFGCAKALDAGGKEALVALAAAFVGGNAKSMAKAMEQLGFATASGTTEGLEAYARLVLDEVARIRALGGGWPDQAEVLAQLTRLAGRLEQDPMARLPVEMVMLGRVFGTLSGLFLHYAPDMSAAGAVLPMLLARLANQRRQPAASV